MSLLKVLVSLAFLCSACDDGGTAAPKGQDAAALADAAFDSAEADAQADAQQDAQPDAAVAEADAATPDAFLDPNCDRSQPPLVMAHGLLAAGDTWSPHAQRFAANGHCPDSYYAFDWATLDRAVDHPANLDAFIDRVRARHGVQQVDLMGHSAGGGLGYQYLADPAHAAKVRRYVHVASAVNPAPAGPEGSPMPMLNLWSEGDLIVNGADIPGAENLQIPEQDHYSVATAPESFVALYQFLYGAAPAIVEAGPQPPILLAGKGLILADNTPETGGVLSIWPVNAADGQRVGNAPVATFTLGDTGAWGPFAAQPNQHYEFHLQPARPVAPVRYYREPFKRSDPLVYLRTLPTAGIAGALLRQVPFDDAHTVLVVFSASAAVIAGRDSLTLDSEELATPEIASAEETAIAVFVYDVGTDGEPGGPIATFAALPFLTGVDRPIPADATQHSTIVFNGRTLNVPRLPSGTEGAVIASFN